MNDILFLRGLEVPNANDVGLLSGDPISGKGLACPLGSPRTGLFAEGMTLVGLLVEGSSGDRVAVELAIASGMPGVLGAAVELGAEGGGVIVGQGTSFPAEMGMGTVDECGCSDTSEETGGRTIFVSSTMVDVGAAEVDRMGSGEL